MKDIVFSERYMEIIRVAQQRNWNQDEKKAEGIYTEKHHIIPKSIAEELRLVKENMVCLTASEHFEAHVELYNSNKDVREIAAAFVVMVQKTQNKEMYRDYDITPELYEECRKAAAELQTGDNNILRRSPEAKAKHLASVLRGADNPAYGHPNNGGVARKKIRCLEHPELEFESCRHAVRVGLALGWTGVDRASLYRCLNKKTHCFTAWKDTNGTPLHWEYII